MVALLIDGESLGAVVGRQIVDWALIKDRIRFGHVFGDFSNPSHAAWCGMAQQLGLKAELTQPLVSRKNTADIALTVKAMDLFHSASVREFCVAAHDRDYVPLLQRLRELGAQVYLVSRSVDEPMRRACDEWLNLERTPQAAQSPSVMSSVGRLVAAFSKEAGPSGVLPLNVAGTVLRNNAPELLAGLPKSHTVRGAYEATKLFEIYGTGNDTFIKLRSVSAPHLALTRPAK